jgi:hypothetical protein
MQHLEMVKHLRSIKTYLIEEWTLFRANKLPDGVLAASHGISAADLVDELI